MLVKGPNLSKRVSQAKTDKVTGYIRKKNFLTKEFVPIFKVSSKKAEIFTKRNKKLVNLDDMNELKYVKKITTKEFEQDNTLYNIFSSLREKVNAPARNRTNKD